MLLFIIGGVLLSDLFFFWIWLSLRFMFVVFILMCLRVLRMLFFLWVMGLLFLFICVVSVSFFLKVLFWNIMLVVLRVKLIGNEEVVKCFMVISVLCVCGLLVIWCVIR